MLTDVYGRSISNAKMTLLYSNVIVNMSLIMFLSMDNLITAVRLDEYRELKKGVFIFETFMISGAISISFIITSSSSSSKMKLSTYQITFATLFVSIVVVSCSFPTYLASLMNNFPNNESNENRSAELGFHCFLISVILTVYFALKLYTAQMMFTFGTKPIDTHQDENIEQDTPQNDHSWRDLPPSYNECVVESESTPPPSYSDVQNNVKMVLTRSVQKTNDLETNSNGKI